MIRTDARAGVLLGLGLGAALLASCQSADAPTPDGGPTPGTTGPAATAGASPPAGATRPPAATPPTGTPGESLPATSAPATAEPLGAVAWTPAAAPFEASDFINGVTAAPWSAAGELFAVGTIDYEERAAAWRSTDGQSWQQLELPGADLATASAVTDGPAGLVAVGESGDGAPTIWHSPDGASWQQLSGSALGGNEPITVAGGPRGYLVLVEDFADGSYFVSASTDGRDWSAAQPASGIEPGAAISGLEPAGDRFLAYGTSSSGMAATWASTDGTGWQPVEIPDQGGEAINGIAVIDSLIVAIGRGGDVMTNTLVWVSSDGQAWQPVPDAAIDGDVYDIAPWRGGFVAVGEVQQSESEFEAVAWASSDGRSWQRSPENDSFIQARMNHVVPATETLVAIGERIESGRGPLYDEPEAAVWLGRESEP